MTDKRSTMPSDFTGLDTGSAKGKNRSRHLQLRLEPATLRKVGPTGPVVSTRWHPEKDTQHATPVRELVLFFFLWVRVGFNSDLLVQRGPVRSRKRKKRASRASSFLRKLEECEVWWVLMLLSLAYLSEETWHSWFLMHFIHLFQGSKRPSWSKCNACMLPLLLSVPQWYLLVASALPVPLCQGCQEWTRRCHTGNVCLASLTNLEVYIELLLMVDAPLFRWYLMCEVWFLLLEHIEIGNQFGKVTCIHIGMQETDRVAFQLHIYRSPPNGKMMPCQDQRSHTGAKKEWDSSLGGFSQTLFSNFHLR